MSNANRLIGFHAVTAGLRYESARLRKIWVASGRHDARVRQLIALAQGQGVAVENCDAASLKKLAGGARHQGVVAEYEAAESAAGAKRPLGEADLADLLGSCAASPLLLVLDGVQDPHNLGACLRTAAAAGVDAVLAPSDRAVGLTPTVRKIASGGAEQVPFIAVTNLARTLRWFRSNHVWLVGTAEQAQADTEIYQVDFSVPTAIVMGGEEKGLRQLTRQHCDAIAAIPLAGETGRDDGLVSSLNVSVATGVVLFEALRQRALARAVTESAITTRPSS